MRVSPPLYLAAAVLAASPLPSLAATYHSPQTYVLQERQPEIWLGVLPEGRHPKPLSSWISHEPELWMDQREGRLITS